MSNDKARKPSVIRTGLVWLLVLAGIAPLSTLPIVPSPEARADFQQLGDASSVANLRELCDDIQAVTTIVRFYRKAFKISAARDTTTFSGITASLVEEADYIPKMCTLIMAVLTARNTEGILRAARIASRIAGLGLENEIDFAEESIGMYDFASRLTKIKDNRDLKQKLLNVNNHARIVNFMQRWGLAGDGTEGAKREAAAMDRQSKMVEITTKLFEGCRRPIFKPTDPSMVPTPDGELSPIQALLLFDKTDEAVKRRDGALVDANKAHETLNHMLAQIISDPTELESASYILAKFRREAFWLSVGYIPPTGDAKTAPKSKFIPNEHAEYGAGEKIRELDHEEFDMTGVFYEDQGTSDASQCFRKNKDKYQAEAWLMNNTTVLIDRYIKSKEIAQAVEVCPGSPEEAIDGVNVDMVAPKNKDPGLAEAVAKINSKRVEDNCQKLDVAEHMKRLRKLKSLGDEPLETAELRVQQNDCKPTLEDEIRLTPITYVDNESIKNMRDFMTYYNDKFAYWVETQYHMAIKENPVSNSLRNFVADPINEFMAGIFPNSKRSKWDPNDAKRLSDEQRKFYSDWRQFSFCSLPRTLEKRYPDEFETASKNMKDDPEALTSLIRKCKFDENQPAANDRIFEDFFRGMLASMEVFEKSRQTIMQTDLIMGAYRTGANLKNKKGCLEPLMPTDINMAMAKSVTVLFEEIADAHAFQREVQLKSDEEKAQAKEAAAQIQRIWAVTANMKKTTEAKSLLYRYDLNNGDNADYQGMMPSLIEQRVKEKRFQYDYESNQ